MNFIPPDTLSEKMYINFGVRIGKMAINSSWKCYGSEVFHGARLMCPMEHTIDRQGYYLRSEVGIMVRRDIKLLARVGL